MKTLVLAGLLAVASLGLSSCRLYGYLLGYPLPARPVDYTYYDPKFAAHNQAQLRHSKLKTTGLFYFRPTQAVDTGPSFRQGPPQRRFEYLRLNMDGSFYLLNVAVNPCKAYDLFGRMNPTGYYQLRGDTALLETQAGLGRVVAQGDSVQVFWPSPGQPPPTFFRFRP